MKPLWPIALAVIANIFYHVAQQRTPHHVNPTASLIYTYVFALLLTGGFVAFKLVTGETNVTEVREAFSLPALALGASVLLLELGFLYSYRVGWDLGLATIYVNVVVGIVLIPIGILFAHEHLSMRRGAGIALALVAIFLLSETRPAAAAVTTEDDDAEAVAGASVPVGG